MLDGTGRWRNAARALRHAPDRLLHTRRAHAARLALPALAAGDRVLVLCQGNICRSPYAAAALRRAFAGSRLDGVSVESAGFMGPGRPMPAAGLETAAARGLDLGRHRAQLVSASLLERAQLVLVMDVRQRMKARAQARANVPVLVLGDFDDPPIDTRTIRDPWDQPTPVFAEVFTRIDRCVAGLVVGLQAVTPRPPSRSGA